MLGGRGASFGGRGGSPGRGNYIINNFNSIKLIFIISKGGGGFGNIFNKLSTLLFTIFFRWPRI